MGDDDINKRKNHSKHKFMKPNQYSQLDMDARFKDQVHIPNNPFS